MKLLRLSEAADRIGLSVYMTRRLITAGKIQAKNVSTSGRSYYVVAEAECERYLASIASPTSPPSPNPPMSPSPKIDAQSAAGFDDDPACHAPFVGEICSGKPDSEGKWQK